MSTTQILDVGDGKTIDRDLAIEATRHILIALKLLLEVSSLDSDVLRDLADQKVAYMLGGDDWLEIASDLIDEVLKADMQS